MIFHLDYSEKACQDHAALVIFNSSFEAGSHDPIIGSDFYSNSKKLQTRINISMSLNNAREKIGSKSRIMRTSLKTVIIFSSRLHYQK